mmetsp:Transcript_5310/g.22527  ORF Transcript_5310/g.22527 Transcript_5310/m.22527 type:complete len:214 (+) Transcript_5310:836-1477(+)
MHSASAIALGEVRDSPGRGVALALRTMSTALMSREGPSVLEERTDASLVSSKKQVPIAFVIGPWSSGISSLTSTMFWSATLTEAALTTSDRSVTYIWSENALATERSAGLRALRSERMLSRDSTEPGRASTTPRQMKWTAPLSAKASMCSALVTLFRASKHIEAVGGSDEAKCRAPAASPRSVLGSKVRPSASSCRLARSISRAAECTMSPLA